MARKTRLKEGAFDDAGVTRGALIAALVPAQASLLEEITGHDAGADAMFGFASNEHATRPIEVDGALPGLAIQLTVGSPEAAAMVQASTGGRARWTLGHGKSDTCENAAEQVTQSASHTDQPCD